MGLLMSLLALQLGMFELLDEFCRFSCMDPHRLSGPICMAFGDRVQNQLVATAEPLLVNTWHGGSQIGK